MRFIFSSPSNCRTNSLILARWTSRPTRKDMAANTPNAITLLKNRMADKTTCASILAARVIRVSPPRRCPAAMFSRLVVPARISARRGCPQRLVDHPHTAATELLYYAVMRNGLADHAKTQASQMKPYSCRNLKRLVGVTSRFHSKPLKKANRRRTLALSPVCVEKSRFTTRFCPCWSRGYSVIRFFIFSG